MYGIKNSMYGRTRERTQREKLPIMVFRSNASPTTLQNHHHLRPSTSNAAPTTLQNHHHLHHSFRSPAQRNLTHHSTTNSTKISANPPYRRLIITSFHMAKARRSKIKAKSRVHADCNLKPNRSGSVQIWTWKNRSTIGDGRKQPKATGSAQGGKDRYKSDKPKNFVVILNANGDYKMYKLWFEGVSEGCANCGAEEHQFELCPLRMTRNKAKEGKKEKNLVQDNASDIHFSEESSVDKGKQKMEWNETLQEWPQGADIQHQMKEGNIQQTDPMLNQQILPQNEEWRGIEENMIARRKTEEMEAESFKTGIGPTTLTQGMEAIQVTEHIKQNKKQKRGNRLEAASSSSKRSKTSN